MCKPATFLQTYHHRLNRISGELSLVRQNSTDLADSDFTTLPDDFHDFALRDGEGWSISFGHGIARLSIRRCYARRNSTERERFRIAYKL